MGYLLFMVEPLFSNNETIVKSTGNLQLLYLQCKDHK